MSDSDSETFVDANDQPSAAQQQQITRVTDQLGATHVHLSASLQSLDEIRHASDAIARTHTGWQNTFKDDSVWQSMQSDFESVEKCLALFLDSEFDASEKRLLQFKDTSLYHSVGYGVILFLKAIMTVEAQDVQRALTAMRATVEMTEKYRKSSSGVLLGLVTQTIRSDRSSLQLFKEMTPVQRHAELIFAESIIMRALLTLLADDGNGVVTIMREAASMRSSYNIYRTMQLFLEDNATHVEDDTFIPLDPHLTSGVALGIGLFHVLMSMLPGKLLKMFQMIGMNASRPYGLAVLAQASTVRGLRAEMCQLGLLGFHTLVGPHMQLYDYDLHVAAKLLDNALKKYPKGALFLFFSGRYLYASGKSDEAVPQYGRAVAVQSQWRQLHHLCYWEQMQCAVVQLDFATGAQLAETLSRESRWSPAFYSYIHGLFLCMQSSDPKTGQLLSPELLAKAKQCFQKVEGLRRKIAGKSIPIEKFVARKARKFLEQGDRLFLPVFEFLLIWNGLSRMKRERLTTVLDWVESRLHGLLLMTPQERKSYSHFHDDLYLAYLSKAVMQRHLGELAASQQTFELLSRLDGNVELDQWMLPFARFEWAQLYMLQEQYTQARIVSEQGREKWKHYSLENMIRMRLQNCKRQAEALEKGLEGARDNDSEEES